MNASLSSWNVSDYGPVTGPGALKAIASGIAPLVLLAQGCTDLTAGSVDDLIEALALDARNPGRKQLHGVVSSGGTALTMPWHTPAATAMYWLDRGNGVIRDHVPMSSLQVRPDPAYPVFTKKGRKQEVAKYVNLVDNATRLGVSPATPPSWLTTSMPKTVWIAEGLLKGMALLTAMLIESGVAPSALTVTAGLTTHDARDAVRTMLEAIADDERALVICIVGSGNWHKHAEWNSIDLRDVTVYLALDGDVDGNPNVAREAVKLGDFVKGRGGNPTLLRLATMDGYQEKDGVDDVLGRGGDLDSVRDCATTTFPDLDVLNPPSGWRMNPETLTTQKLVDDGNGGTRWQTVYPYVARIVDVVFPRQVDPVEMKTGRIIPVHEKQGECQVTVEFSWRTKSGDTHHLDVRGDQNMLYTLPGKWMLPNGGRVTMPATSIGSDPGLFPPREDEFLGAMRSYRATETVYRPGWRQMGWVPTKDDGMVFVAGECVAGADGMLDHDVAGCGITEADLIGANDFGFQMPTTAKEAKTAIETVVDAFLPADSADQVWSDPLHAAIFLAAALRPCVPLPCRAPMYLSGGSGLGKSWSAGAVMHFWQPDGGRWSDQRLPGSAKDTALATELAVSMAPIWVTDDVAPNGPDKGAQARMENMIEELLRNVHNGTARRRSSPSLKSAQTHLPIAQTIVSAEQALSNVSILNRIIHIRVEPGFLNPSRVPTDKIVELADGDCPQSMVTGGLITFIAQRAQASSWEQMRADMRDLKEVTAQRFVRQTGGSGGNTRQCNLAADFYLPLILLKEWASSVKVSPDHIRRIVLAAGSLKELARISVASKKDYDLGVDFMEHITALLTSGGAHIASPSPSQAPSTTSCGDLDADEVNARLGWQTRPGEGPRPNGPRIGTLMVRTGGDGTVHRHVVFDARAAHNEVTRRYPRLNGHGCEASWQAVHRSNLSDGRFQRRKTPSGNISIVQQAMVDGQNFRGVIVALDVVIGAVQEDSTDDDASPTPP
ncbi:hypothetical protein [Nostocoides vanveenii]|uniref:DUF927 domain-containing protein n=1 Tax=Nostocoides vanveenii TaxID=330835 RepID=A0ABN2KDZ9_9MICO